MVVIFCSVVLHFTGNDRYTVILEGSNFSSLPPAPCPALHSTNPADSYFKFTTRYFTASTQLQHPQVVNHLPYISISSSFMISSQKLNVPSFLQKATHSCIPNMFSKFVFKTFLAPSTLVSIPVINSLCLILIVVLDPN